MTISGMNIPWISQLERDFVHESMRDEYWDGTNWYFNEQFRKEFGEYIGREYCITTPSCTTSIHLLMAGLGIGQGDEVIAPNLTWIASVSSVYHLGARIVFADVDPQTWCLSVDSVEKYITPHTKAIISVDLYSCMPDYNRLEKLCKERDILLIEDAAQGIGSSYCGKKAGNFGVGSCFSFHRTKTLTTGEGGALVLDDETLYEKCMQLRDHGKDPHKMYYNTMVGFKYMPTNVLSAIGLAQLRRVDQLLERKKWEFSQYQQYLSDIPDIQLNYSDTNIKNGYWMTTLVFGKEWEVDKHHVISELEQLGIPSRPVFYPLTSLPAFNKHSLLHEDTRKRMWPVSYDISERGINLPTSPYLTVEDIKYICKSIKEILQKEI